MECIASGWTAVPNEVIDVWMPLLPAPLLRLALFLLRHGYVGECGLPTSERYRVATGINVSRRYAYNLLSAAATLGVVIQTPPPKVSYALNLAWHPREGAPNQR